MRFWAVAHAAFALMLMSFTSVSAQEPSPRATVNGDIITAEALDARQYDLIGKETIVKTVLDESRQLSRNPSVQQDLKSLLAAVVQEKPEASKEEILATTQERSLAYTKTLAVRRVKPKLFAEVETQALDQLIDEQLMLQEAKRQGVVAADADVDAAISATLKRAGADDEDLHKLLVAWDKRALPSVKARANADLSWKLITAKAGLDDSAAKQKLETLRQAAKIERIAPPAAPQ